MVDAVQPPLAATLRVFDRGPIFAMELALGAPLAITVRAHGHDRARLVPLASPPGAVGET